MTVKKEDLKLGDILKVKDGVDADSEGVYDPLIRREVINLKGGCITVCLLNASEDTPFTINPRLYELDREYKKVIKLKKEVNEWLK